MDCSNGNIAFAIKLNEKAPFNLNTLFDSIKGTGEVVVTYSADKQSVEVPEINDKALFISFNALKFSNYEEILFYSLVYKIAEKFGIPMTDPKNGAKYPCIHDSTDDFLLLVKASQWNEQYEVDYLVDKQTGVIMTDDQWDELDVKFETDDTVFENYDSYSFLDIIDSHKFMEPEPSFFLSKIFWRKRKEKYETVVKKALTDADQLWQKVRY